MGYNPCEGFLFGSFSTSPNRNICGTCNFETMTNSMSRSKKKKHTAEPVLASPASTDEQDPVAPVWSRKARIIASLLVSFHIFAIFIAPMAFPRPSSELSRSVAKIAEPYYVAGFLRPGYRFFAPNPPSASFIVRYRLTMPDGTNREGEFPNLKEHRPRLLYHRQLTVKLRAFVTVRVLYR